MPCCYVSSPLRSSVFVYMAGAGTTPDAFPGVDPADVLLASMLDRPGRSFNIPLSHYALPRVVTQGLTDECGRASRIPVRLHLSHRVLTYMRRKLWAVSLTDRASFEREPVDVSS